jgi:hypothetical protein
MRLDSPRLFACVALIATAVSWPMARAAAQGSARADLDARWLTADRLACELAVRTRDLPMLERCTANLYAGAPRDPGTVQLQWALALTRGQTSEARELIERARTVGLPPEDVERMEEASAALLPDWADRVRGRELLTGVFATLVGFGLFLAFRRPNPMRPPSTWRAT